MPKRIFQAVLFLALTSASLGGCTINIVDPSPQASPSTRQPAAPQSETPTATATPTPTPALPEPSLTPTAAPSAAGFYSLVSSTLVRPEPETFDDAGGGVYDQVSDRPG